MTGERVALKRIFIRRPDDGMPLNVLREYTCLRCIDHPQVMRILDVFPSVRCCTLFLALQGNELSMCMFMCLRCMDCAHVMCV